MPEVIRDREQLRAPEIVNLPPPTTPRVQVTIKRGPTDTIGKTVFEHEIPILEEIHGAGNVLRVTETDPDGRKLIRAALRGKGPVVSRENFPDDDLMADSVIEMKHFDPADDPREEYNRMVHVYGMHIEQAMPNVEVVFGRYDTGRFEAAVRGAKVRGHRAIADEDIDTMRASEIRAKLVDMKVEFDPKATALELRATLRGAIGA